MRQFIAALLIVSIVPRVALGEEPATVSAAVVSPLKKSQPAPFAGVLFSQPAAAGVVAELSITKERTSAEVTKAVKLAVADKQLELDDFKAQCKSEKTVLGVDIAAKKKDIARLDAELSAANGRIKKLEGDMPSRSTWFTVGLISGIVTTVAAVFAVNQATK